MGARNPIKAALEVAIPGGVLWLSTDDLPHPEASRMTEIPFLFETGRVADGARKRTSRESQMVAALSPDAGGDTDALRELLTAYARFVVATVPTVHARLTGKALADFQSSQAHP